MTIINKNKNHRFCLYAGKKFQGAGIMISTDEPFGVMKTVFYVEIRFLWLLFWYAYKVDYA